MSTSDQTAHTLAGKTLFITGGTRGIGLAIAERAARDGANVVIAAKTAEPHPKLPGTIHTAVEAIEKAGGRGLGVQCDIREEAQVLAAVQQAVAERWTAVTGKPLTEGYGLSETSPGVCFGPLDRPDWNGTIGLPLPGTLVSLRDDDGKEVPQGEPGELCVKGPQVMQGYWNKPEDNAKSFTEDGLFKTGDIAVMDAKGYFRIVDRKKDMILVSGFNVYPNEIEDVVARHPGVLECACIGIPDTKTGEAVKVFVVKKDNSLTAEDLKDHCKNLLTGYKAPKAYEFLEALPKSNVGKILRKELRGK